MRLALLSDLHANLRATQACLAHARAQGAGPVAFLGDLVGYGAEPAEVVDLVQAELAEGGFALQGNHDELAVRGVAAAGADASAGAASAAWTHAQLTADQRAFLSALPLVHADGPALFVHASADAPAAWHYVDHPRRAAASLEAACAGPGVRYVFGGHVHHQRLFYAGRRGDLMAFDPVPGAPIPVGPHRRWLATVGSVGQPRDGDHRAMYALWEPTPVARLTFHRVAYDHQAAAAAIRRAGLPAQFADRLEEAR